MFLSKILKQEKSVEFTKMVRFNKKGSNFYHSGQKNTLNTFLL
jgi:hypothetical protein